ncbi:PA14 domain-containing protein [Calothrix sp. NIES-3974]|uniref:PA14 domain-containing protein n=1 Tax=Calothrix sp. NIES-3974 TaxID=2005462 RepID=UPI000B622AB5|nr:PA14 domain-containing protein [Calothrix sp. NIES-3974]BAZ08038.1 PA14 domain-containing protein [Calothrix sp. NIES-3974]
MQNSTRIPINNHNNSPFASTNPIVNLNSPLDTNLSIPSATTFRSASSTNSFRPAAIETNGLRGEYFDNIDFTNLRLTRIDPTINFNWGSGSPDPTIEPDTFSVRWTGRIRPETSGNYRFFTTTDDGVQLFINGELVINRFRDQGATEIASIPLNLVAGQDYTIQMNYYENRGLAVSRLAWERPDGVKEIVPESRLFTPQEQTTVIGTGTGLRGEYYDNINFTNLVLTRIDPTVNFDWGSGSPDAAIAPDTFSVRWTGFVQPLYSETYTFFTTTDDGVRLKLNGRTIIDRFRDQAATEVASTPITLVAGEKYAIELEYYENRGQAVSRLGWSSPSQFKQIIAQSQLYAEITPPSATVTTNTLSTPGSQTYQFTVTYTDDTGIDVGSIDNADILVTGPNSFSQLARLVSVNDGINGTPRTATYEITAPSGIWGNADNGVYNIALQGNQVRDISGNFAVATNLGTFRVDIPNSEVGNGLRAEYYDNINFTNLVLVRTDPTINFNFGSGSPDPRIAPDTFSIRWSGQVQPRFSEDYIFYTRSDDGIRVRINGQTVINRFVDQPVTEVASVPISLVAGQKYDIVVEYYENRGLAVAELLWSSPSQTKQIIPQSQLFSTSTPIASLTANDLTLPGQPSYTFTVTYTDDTGIDISSLDNNDIRITGPGGFTQLAEFVSIDTPANGTPRVATYRLNPPGEAWLASHNGRYTVSLEANQVRDISGNFATATELGSFLINISGTGTGLRGEYYDNINFTNLRLTRTDPTINYNWGTGSPDPLIAPDTFSVVWSGLIEAKYNELYTFYTTTDDGVRLFINDQLVINSFIDQPATERSGSITLEAGKKYDIRMEYYERAGLASARLEWSSPTQTRQIIPSTQLYPFVVPPVIRLGNIPGSVGETEGSIEIEILRTGENLNQTSSVRYFTQGVTATPGQDFVQTEGIATFAPNQTRLVVSVPIIDDNIIDPDETFAFVIDQAENATLGPQRTATITILDNESTDLVFDDIRVDENVGEAVITVRRSNIGNAASVNYATVTGVGDLAQPLSDYQPVSGTLAFTPTQTTATIRIPIINDTIGEINETFTLQFSNPVGVTLNPNRSSSKITIIDDDPGNFIRELVISGLTQPTSFDWVPIPETANQQFLLIAQKDGTVRVARNGQLQQEVFIDISNEVNNTRDRGLLAIAVHPNFAENPYVYLLYTYDPPEVFNNINPNTNLDDPDGRGNRPSRLLRVNGEYIRDTNGNITGLRAVPNSGVVILGTNSTWGFTSRADGNSTNIVVNSSGAIDFANNFAPSGIVNQNGQLFTSMADYYQNLDTAVNVQDYLATDSESHSIGYLAFGADGKLYVSNGDGTSYNRVDPRSIRVQDVNNLSGKLLRIDPITGEGLSDNPFFDGNPNSNRSKVFSLGLRNPFRFTINQTTGRPYIGDVGWFRWEEVNTGGAGSNYGWPYYEGGFNPSTNTPLDIRQPEYSSLTYTYTNPQGQVVTVRPAQDFYRDFGDAAVTAPVYAYQHFAQNAIIMGDFYTGNQLPSIYQGQLFVADSSQATIDSIRFDSAGNFVSIQRFASNAGIPVQITTGPDEYLYYADLGIGSGEGGIYRYRISIV